MNLFHPCETQYDKNINPLCRCGQKSTSFKRVEEKMRKDMDSWTWTGACLETEDYTTFVSLVWQMNIISGGFYDGLMLYIHALTETMAVSVAKPVGSSVTRRMWNRTYHGQSFGQHPHLEFLSSLMWVKQSYLCIYQQCAYLSLFLCVMAWVVVSSIFLLQRNNVLDG